MIWLAADPFLDRPPPDQYETRQDPLFDPLVAELIKFNNRYDVDFLYTTTTLGVDPGYSSQSFYSGIMGKDTARVNGRFADAAQNGVRVERRVVESI